MPNQINTAGGELAAQISPRIRIDMIQKGYNPMNPEDVQRYINHQQPIGDIKYITTEYVKEGQDVNTMGEKHMSYRKDYAAIKQTFNEGNLDLDTLDDVEKISDTEDGLPQDTQIENPISNPRQHLKKIMENTREHKSNINDRLNNSIFNNVPQKAQQKNKFITIPKSQKEYITEVKQATSLGYTQACKYINAFIMQIKNPTLEGRIKFINEINEMILTEEKIHPQILHEYRKGIAKAELEFYQNIKKIKNQ
jgi:hypothetical protein